jgi:nondiscriminating aspartyl-tRNA synthetase
MLNRTITIQTLDKTGDTVMLSGWVERVRSHGKIAFFDLKDRGGVIQVVGATSEIIESISKITPQSVVQIVGKVNERGERYINANMPLGTVEIELTEPVKIISLARELPFDMGGQELNLQLPTLLDFRALTLRHQQIAPIFKVQEVVIDTFRKALKAKDFTEFQAPVIIPQTAEGGSEVFEVKYFDHKAYLAQSPQFYKQILVGVYERVFAVNKTLRAEPSVTTRHLTEVTTLDAEFGFINSWEELVDMAEYVITTILDTVDKESKSILELYKTTIPKIGSKIPRVKLREAQEIIKQRTDRDVTHEPDLSPEDEKEICKWAQEEKDSELVFVTHYPVSKRPFYTYEDPEDKGYTLSFDLIGRGTEWMTGGQRINDYETLVDAAKSRGINLEKSELYLQAFRFGMPPEGGFSFGSERITMHILGLSNVREASLFPRDMERIDERLSSIEQKNKE